MKVLIVGCGYIGLPLAQALVQQGHTVYGLRRRWAEPPPADILPLEADITRLASLSLLPREYDWVVNCAAAAGGQVEAYRDLYVVGNQNLCSWLAARPPRKWVYTSSTGVYGQNDGSEVSEASPTEPEAPTARVLVEAENCLQGAARDQFPTVILRVAGIYGPGRGYALQQFLRGEARLEGEGARFLNMIHRDDVIGAILAALDRGQPGAVYNAVDHEPVSQAAFFGWLAAALQRPLPPRAAMGEELPRKRGVTNKRVSGAKLRSELGYQFKYPDFRAGYRALLPRP